ncbi:MAG: 2Fe-2S iron-sulfur cluster binding domain-containing protein [Holosporaceae bacterium]|jgi:2Fe-2S ferredoxin|nr:2Fe-2S iron-sulfur cluster binding domain-containing protein [Holosporaceae bacterium]
MEIVFILKNGEERNVSFSENQTILAVAEENHIPLGSACEGFGVCGGCHVIIENLEDKLPQISEREEDTLDKAKGVTLKSRLACRVVLDKSLNGLRVKLV